MKRTRTITLYMVSISLLSIILIGLFFHYPLNLIVDGIVLAVVGISSLIYILIWSVLNDKVVVCESHISIYRHGFPFWNLREKRVGFPNIEYYVIHGNDTILATIHGDIIHIDRYKHEDGGKENSLREILDQKRIRSVPYNDFIKGRVKTRKSYLSRM